jgi:hypothetical protein
VARLPDGNTEWAPHSPGVHHRPGDTAICRRRPGPAETGNNAVPVGNEAINIVSTLLSRAPNFAPVNRPARQALVTLHGSARQNADVAKDLPSWRHGARPPI